MAIAATLCILLSGLAALLGGIWLLVTAFRESLGWGLVVLLVPLGALAFVIARWEAARRPFVVQLLAGGFLVAGAQFAWRTVPLLDGASPKERERARAGDDLLTRFKAVVDEKTADFDRKRRPAYVGRTLDEVREELGRPEGILSSDGRVTYLYPEFELVADDGVTVSSQRTPAH